MTLDDSQTYPRPDQLLENLRYYSKHELYDNKLRLKNFRRGVPGTHGLVRGD